MRKFLLILTLSFMSLYAKSLPLYFSGNNSINSLDLYNALSIEVPYFYEFYKQDPSIELKTLQLNKLTLKNYYKFKGFYDVEIEVDQSTQKITMNIRENSPILINAINMSSSYDLKSLLDFKIGDRFDAEKFTKSKKELLLFYSKKGYCGVDLQAKTWIDTELNEAYLDYNLNKGELCYFDDIVIQSSENIDVDIIKPLLYIEKENIYSSLDIIKSYENLYAYGGVSKARINTLNEDNNLVKVEVLVEESEKAIRLETGFGFSSDEGFMGSLGLRDSNFGGNLKTIGFNTRITQILQDVKLFYEMPFMSHNVFGANIGFENEKFVGFKEKRFYSVIHMKQRKNPHNFQEEIVLDSSEGYESDDLSLFPENKLFIVSPRFTYSFDTRDKILEPQKGYFINAQVMGSLKSSFSDASYYKYNISGAYILPIKESIGAFKVDFGSLNVYDGKVPASYRFFTGGMYTNRAYTYRKLGPTNEEGDPIGSDSLLNAILEYRFDIYRNFRGVLFSDNTFIGNSEIPDYESGYYSAGIGLRYKTPIGPLAIDMGIDLNNPLEQYAFHFHIGELF